MEIRPLGTTRNLWSIRTIRHLTTRTRRIDAPSCRSDVQGERSRGTRTSKSSSMPTLVLIPPTLVQMCKDLEEFKPYFIEDLLRSENPASYRNLRNQVNASP